MISQRRYFSSHCASDNARVSNRTLYGRSTDDFCVQASTPRRWELIGSLGRRRKGKCTLGEFMGTSGNGYVDALLVCKDNQLTPNGASRFHFLLENISLHAKLFHVESFVLCINVYTRLLSPYSLYFSNWLSWFFRFAFIIAAC
jgi:hypothetical protein